MISLQPPLDHKVRSGAEAETALVGILDDLGMELGERKLLSHADSAMGVMAFAVHTPPKAGLVQFWVIPAQVTVFATYEIGNLETVKQEMLEAHRIMLGLRLEKGSN